MSKQLDEILDDISSWCDECSHPVCLGKKASTKAEILKWHREEVEQMIEQLLLTAYYTTDMNDELHNALRGIAIRTQQEGVNNAHI